MLRFLFPYTVFAVDENGKTWAIYTSARRWLVARGQVIGTLAPGVHITTIRRRAPLWMRALRGWDQPDP